MKLGKKWINMNIIKPKKLQKGDTIGILAVSGKIKEYENIEKAKSFFEREGYNVIISDTCRTSHQYMAGNSDDDCVKAFHDFFLNKKINAIVSARGGYGTLRLINKINWDIVKNNPKIFAGYSDITVLLNTIFKNTGLITFHSAMANGDFANEIQNYTKESFFKTLSGEATYYQADNHSTFYSGITKGILWGGNLATLTSLCGIDFIPNEDLILFIEDLNEPVYKIDKMLTQLFNIEKAKANIKGIAIGEFKDIENKSKLNEILKGFANELKIPMCDGFKITHNKIKDTIPVGANAIFDSNTGRISIKDKYTI